MKERSFYLISRIVLFPLAQPYLLFFFFPRLFTFSLCIWDKRICLNFNLSFELVTFLNLFQNGMLKIGQSKFSNPLGEDLDHTLLWSAGLRELCVPQRHLWWAEGAGSGKGSASVLDDLLQVVNSELKCLKWSIYYFFLLSYSTILIFLPSTPYIQSLWLFTPSPNVLSVPVIFHTISWGENSCPALKWLNQQKKWAYRTSETLLLKLRHFSLKKSHVISLSKCTGGQ